MIATLVRGAVGPFQLQAAISAVHADAADFDHTDWREICRLYEKLHEMQPSPIVALNGVVARSFADGASAGLAALDALDLDEMLGSYMPYHLSRADMLRRTGDRASAHAAYLLARKLTDNDSERNFLDTRIAETSLPEC
ncbi:MAG: hypothetical protein VX741_05135 [Pseudomonadota bacterium]|nr:hypothetical protein [Pseudomonadota bacterium]